MKVFAVIQARMGSTRFPGKVLKLLAGRPVMWHIIHRLKKCQCLDGIAVATSELPVDDDLADFACAEGVEVVRGSENNVLARYLLAVKRLGADYVVRITGDAPLVDPGLIDCMVARMIEQKADYIAGRPDLGSVDEGIDPVSVAALRRLDALAAGDPVAREHVTGYFKVHPEFVRTVLMEPLPGHVAEGVRLSVDTPADLRFLNEVYRRLGAEPGEAAVADVVDLLLRHPELRMINAGVRQKTPSEKTRKVFFRCDGDSDIGLGHVVRCIALADELRERHAHGITFLMRKGPPGWRLVEEAGYAMVKLSETTDEWMQLEALLADQRPDALIMDFRNGIARERVSACKKKFGLLIASIDDPEDKRLAADLVFYPPIPQVERIDWSGFKGRRFVGWDWVLLRRQFADLHEGLTGPNRQPSTTNHQPSVLIAMGGSDPAGLTLKALRALELVDEPMDVTVVVGAAHRHRWELADLLPRLRRSVAVKENVNDMATLMSQVDLAVSSFGVTAYELATIGVPAVYLALTPDHAESASAFVGAGMGISLGLHSDVRDSDVADGIRRLLKDLNLRQAMAVQCRQNMDGQGAQRIANVLSSRLEQNDVRT